MRLRFASKTVVISITVVLTFVFTIVLSLPTVGVAGKGQGKEEICHITGTYDFDDGNGEVPIGHLMRVSMSAYPAHIKHGDPEYWTTATLFDGSEVCIFDDDPGELGETMRKAPWLIYPNSPTQMNVKFETGTGVDKDNNHIYIDLNPSSNCAEGHATECKNSFTPYKLGKTLAHDTRLWTFKCDGLKANKDYTYKICYRSTDPGKWEAAHGSFRTAPSQTTALPPRLGFYAFGDSRGAESMHTDYIARRIVHDHNTYNGGDFVIHTGDIVRSGGKVCRAEWINNSVSIVCPWDWFWSGGDTMTYDYVKQMTSIMPIFTTIGNHDFAGPDNNPHNAHFYYHYFQYDYPHQPANPQDLDHFYYSFDWGSAKFWSLTNYPMSKTCGYSTPVDKEQDQMVWLDDELGRTDASWKIVYMHVAAYSCSCRMDNHGYLVSLFEDHDVDLVLQGHNHYYASKTVAGIPYLTLGGGGAKLETDVDYKDCVFKGHADVATGDYYHYAKFKIDHDWMNIKVIDDSGHTFDEILLDRNPRVDFTATYNDEMGYVEFWNNITGHSNSYVWDFGDGNTTSTPNQNLVHHYATNGSYEVTLTACSATNSCSKYTRTIDAPVVDDTHTPPVCDPAWSYDPYSIPEVLGDGNGGGGVAVADINGNGIPDLIVFYIHEISGDNSGGYYVGYDMDATGAVSSWSEKHVISEAFGGVNEGGGIAVADIDGNNSPDLIVFYIHDKSGDNSGGYYVGWNMDATGAVSSWSEKHVISEVFGEHNDGGGIAVADINGNNSPDLIVFNIHARAGADNPGHYFVGWDMDATGAVSSWSANNIIPDYFGGNQQGAGITVADIDKNGVFDLVIFGIENPVGENYGFYRIGWDVGETTGSDATVRAWSDTIFFPGWFGTENQFGGITVKDLNNNGYPDLIPFSIANPAGENSGYYRVGWDLQSNGRAVSICKQAYAIGTTGPAGGCVFHVSDDSVHGLEAAPQDQIAAAEWGCEGTTTGAYGQAHGTGKQNTAKILAACTTPGIAAQLADAYSLNDYTDWFLPAGESLSDILSYCPGYYSGVGLEDRFWSSAEYNWQSAWFWSMDSTGFADKSEQYHVIAVRAF
jgi:PKD repeat protein/predicted phosphodiesterase